MCEAVRLPEQAEAVGACVLRFEASCTTLELDSKLALFLNLFDLLFERMVGLLGSLTLPEHLGLRECHPARTIGLMGFVPACHLGW